MVSNEEHNTIIKIIMSFTFLHLIVFRLSMNTEIKSQNQLRIEMFYNDKICHVDNNAHDQQIKPFPHTTLSYASAVDEC